MDSSDDTEMESGTSGVPNGSASNGAPSGSASAVNVTNGHEANGHGQPSPEDLTYTRESNDYEMEECNESEDEEEISQPLPANSSLLDSVNVTNYLTRNPRVLERFKQGEAMVNEMIHTMSENRNGMDFINAFTPNSVASVSLLHQLYMPQSLQPCVGVNQRTPSPTLGQNISSTIESNQMAAVHTSSRSLCGQPVSSNPRPLSVSPQPGSSRNNGETPMTPSRSNGESSRETDPSSRSLIPVSNQHGTVQSGSNWSYEEQFRQLYEIDDNPERKVFLDKLFSFMHQRGTPINRLPIMAKSVLDLFELYKLVIQRGGLVEVINKKLWQEIIKGLRLPASITSAAFTLRTQYMKYLYPYEQTYEKLSTSCQLQQAIETNKRESRQKPNPTIMAVTYPANRESQSALGMNTLSIGLPGPINPSGSQQPRTPHMLMPNGNQHPQHLTQMPNEYMIKMLNEQRRTIPQDNQSQPIDPIVARMMWMYQQNMYSGRPPTPEPSPPTPEPPTPEPQALDLARSDSDRSSSRPVSPRGEPSSSRRDRENTDQLPATNCKRKSYSDDEEMLENNRKSKAMKTQTVTICEFRPDALVVRIKLDRTVYEGSLPIKHEESGSDTDEPDASGKQQ